MKDPTFALSESTMATPRSQRVNEIRTEPHSGAALSFLDRLLQSRRAPGPGLRTRRPPCAPPAPTPHLVGLGAPLRFAPTRRVMDMNLMGCAAPAPHIPQGADRKSTRLNSS